MKPEINKDKKKKNVKSHKEKKTGTKERKRFLRVEEAKKRQEEYSKLTTEQKIEKLGTFTAKKQRERLMREIV